MTKIKKLFQIGILNTLRLNYHYFGIKGVFHPIVLASRHLRITAMKGKIITKDKSIGAIRLCLGYNGLIDGRSNRGTWENYGIINFAGKAYFNAGSSIVNHGQLSIGDNASFNGNVSLVCYEKVDIGDNTFLSWDCQVMDTDFHKIIKDGKTLNPNKSITIGDHVWIGCGTKVLKGSAIPDGCVIGAGSIVSGKLSEGQAVYINNIPVKHSVEWTS